MATEEQIKKDGAAGKIYRKRVVKSPNFYFPREILLSESWQVLVGGKRTEAAILHGHKMSEQGYAGAIQMYMVFRTKMKWNKLQGSKHKRAGKDGFECTNNGEIQFSYDEGDWKWTFTRRRFRDMLDKLIEVGFIDIAHQGSGLGGVGDWTKYRISERWRNYGTPEFITRKRTKRKAHWGFTKAK